MRGLESLPSIVRQDDPEKVLGAGAEPERDEGMIAERRGQREAADLRGSVEDGHPVQIERLPAWTNFPSRTSSPVRLGCLILTWTSMIWPGLMRPSAINCGIRIVGAPSSSGPTRPGGGAVPAHPPAPSGIGMARAGCQRAGRLPSGGAAAPEADRE